MSRPLVLACGALVRELRAVLDVNGLADSVEVDYLPAPLHNHPERIVPAVEARLADVDADRPVFLGYADCGTGGLLDAFIASATHRIARLPGAHCYEFFAGSQRFAELHEQEIGTFYLTDFLARHFDALVWAGLGLDRIPEMRTMIFGNYRRIVLLSQSGDPEVLAFARSAAERLELELQVEHTGLAPFGDQVVIGIGVGV